MKKNDREESFLNRDCEFAAQRCGGNICSGINFLLIRASKFQKNKPAFARNIDQAPAHL
jgi:hypothetical protein